MTDITGTPVLHLQYLPFGEPWVRQINWNYALLHGESRYPFTGKERDEETGLMYFSDRYYNPDLGIFTQPDKLHYARPHLQSYHYCSNNPSRRIDPSGMLDGDFYDLQGNFLGTDGKNDGKVYLMKSTDVKEAINKKNADSYYGKAQVSTTYGELAEAKNVYDRTVANGGHREEGSMVTNGTSVTRAMQGGDRSIDADAAHVGMPAVTGDRKVSIHSHPLGEYAPFINSIGSVYAPENASKSDLNFFKTNDLNIIVGHSNAGTRTPQASFYNNNPNNPLIGNVTIKSLGNMIQQGKSKSRLF
jgi:RHS repeat-associated protein